MARGTAVVMGGSIAGLCAAGVLARHFEKVIVLERDRLPPGAEHRRGVPQSKHPHFLLNSGRRAIGEIFAGFEDALIAAGGMLLMPSMDAAYCENDGWAPRKSGSMTMVYSSRVLIERVLRDKVRELPAIELREGVTVTGLRSVGGGTAGGHVTGVEYRAADGDGDGDGDGDAADSETYIAADLVVDALGRGSSVVDWLGAAGWAVPPEKTLDAKVTYTSRWYDLPPVAERPAAWWWKHLVIAPTQDSGTHPAEHEFLSNFFPIEGDRAIVCMGSWGVPMPRDVATFETAADQVRATSFGAATRACTPVSPVHLTRATGNKWRRFDLLDVPPIGLVCVGDSICAFNPFYAQGMSSAARSALILGDMLREYEVCDTAFFREFLTRQRKSLAVPWMLAMARDQAYDFATGTEIPPRWRRRLAARLSWPVFNAINAASREDAYVERTFAQVFNLDKSLRQLAADPRFWFGIARYKLRQRLGRTVVPGGFDQRQDPPGTDYTRYARALSKGTAMSQTCDPTAERIAEGLGFSCHHAEPVVSVHNPLHLSSGTMPFLELLIVGGAVFALLHAWRRWRRDGDPANLTLWFASVVYLAVIEPPLYFPGWFGLEKQVGFIFSHNVFTVQFMYNRLPLYIVAFYPALSQLAYELVRTLGVFTRRGAVAGSLAVAFVCQVFYEIFDQLGPQLRWWAWNPDNTKVNQPALASVPMSSMFLFASVSFAGLAYLVVRLTRGGPINGFGIAWRSVVAGALAPLAMLIAGAPAGAFQGHGHLGTQRAIIGVELAVVWAIGLYLIVDAWRAPRPAHVPATLFARTYPPIYLSVLVILWLVALPAYFAASHGVTKQGTRIGSLWYSTLCATAAIGVILAARRASSEGHPVRS